MSKNPSQQRRGMNPTYQEAENLLTRFCQVEFQKKTEKGVTEFSCMLYPFVRMSESMQIATGSCKRLIRPETVSSHIGDLIGFEIHNW